MWQEQFCDRTQRKLVKRLRKKSRRFPADTSVTHSVGGTVKFATSKTAMYEPLGARFGLCAVFAAVLAVKPHVVWLLRECPWHGPLRPK